MRLNLLDLLYEERGLLHVLEDLVLNRKVTQFGVIMVIRPVEK